MSPGDRITYRRGTDTRKHVADVRYIRDGFVVVVTPSGFAVVPDKAILAVKPHAD